MKYTKALLIFIIFFFPLSVALTSTSGGRATVVLFYPLSAMLGVLIGYILAPLFLWVYKTFLGRKLLFGIQDRPNPEKFKGTLKGFFPSLMASNFALSLIFSSVIMNLPIFESYYNEWNDIVFLFFVLATITIAASMTLFSAAWVILNSGIVSTNKEKVDNKRDPIELKSVGGWYLAFLKGYAGISVIIALYTFTMNLYDTYGSQVHFSVFIFIPFLPIFLSLWIIPAIILLDATAENRKKFMLKFCNKIGIKDEIELNIIKK